jgi:LPXTG-motif cell wall-anchored protein
MKPDQLPATGEQIVSNQRVLLATTVMIGLLLWRRKRRDEER